MPALSAPTSLQIEWPPNTEPAFPETLDAGAVHKFAVTFRVDRSLNLMAFAVDYRTNDANSRRFEFKQEFEVVEGPHIDRIQVIPLDDHDDFVSKSVTLMLVVVNPLDRPVTVTHEQLADPVIVEPKDCHSVIVDVDRVSIKFDPNSERLVDDDIDPDQVRKSESLAEQEKSARLEQSEKNLLWSILLLKTALQKKLKMQWCDSFGTSGVLPLNHIVVKKETLLLLKPVPFSVEFGLVKVLEDVWEIKCDIMCEKKLSLNVRISFVLEKEAKDFLLVAGEEETVVEAPGSVIRAVHCLSGQKLYFTARFWMKGVYFVKIGEFFVD
jgi:hypothetical protein